MRCAAGQAHWQNGIAERYGGAWKSVWDKLCVDYKVMDNEIWEATAAVNEARNTLRNKSGFSPRQWVFGSNGRLVPDPEDESDLQLSALSHTTSDEKWPASKICGWGLGWLSSTIILRMPCKRPFITEHECSPGHSSRATWSMFIEK